MIYIYKNATPKLPKSVFVAPNAAVIGDVEIGEDSSVWFNSVLSAACDLPKMGA